MDECKPLPVLGTCRKMSEEEDSLDAWLRATMREKRKRKVRSGGWCTLSRSCRGGVARGLVPRRRVHTPTTLVLRLDQHY